MNYRRAYYTAIVCRTILIVQIHNVIAGVDIDTSNIERLNTDATAWEFTVVLDSAGQVDNILLEWNTAKTQLFNFYYTVNTRLTGSKVFVITVNWNGARSIEERKDGGGEVLVKAMLGATIVDSTIFTITIKFGVEFDIVNIERLNTNATPWEFTVVLDNAGEVDNVLVEWNTAKKPLFNFYYTVKTRLTGSKIFIVTVIWNTARSVEERKDGGGEVLVKAILGTSIVDSTAFTITITWAPTSANITPAGPLTIKRDEELQLTCSSQDKGNPSGTVIWAKDTNIQTEYTNDVLIIHPVKSTDSGMWKCSYSNDHGTSSYSPIVDVRVIWTPTVATIIPSGVYTLIRDEELKLTCSSPDKGNPTGTVVWTKDTSIQTEFIDDVLSINSIKTTDSGIWKCSYKNYHGTSSYSLSVDVQVIYPAADVLLTLSNPGPFKEGDSLDMTCTNSDPGNPVANLLFKMKDMALANLESINSSTYRVNSIYNKHNGPLKCCYNNDAGDTCSDTQHLLVQWDVSTDASIYLDDPNKDVKEGDSVGLDCDLGDKGNPEAVVTWTHNDTVKCGEDNYTLEIKYVQLSDSGEWGCSAANSFSKSNGAIYTLKVLPKSTEADASTIIAALFGSLLIVSIVALVVFICLYYRQKKNIKGKLGGSAQKETTVHYVNIGSETNAGVAPNTPATAEYEDVRGSATSNDQSRNTENPTYMDLDQTDIRQTRNRPAELTVYQSLN